LSTIGRVYRNYIGGRWTEAADSRLLEIQDPSDGSHLADIARSSSEDVDRAVKAARAALGSDWGRMFATDRGRILHRIGEAVQKNVDLLAQLEARDVGKPLKQARADAEALAR
jgi:aldehyde dehydrogenase (NAD+)